MSNIYIGIELYGYCNGYFGKDSYGKKRIEGVGIDWIVAREDDGDIVFATFDSKNLMEEKIMEWSCQPNEDETIKETLDRR